MALLLRYKDEIAAHLARSKLLAHGIVAGVVHDNASTVYGHWLMRPRLVVADEDIDDAAMVLAMPDSPIEDDFVEPQDLDAIPEDLGLRRDVPEFLEAMLLGALVAGGVGLVFSALATAVAIMNYSSTASTSVGFVIPMLPLSFAAAGALGGALAWPLIVFARSCRRDEHGALPPRAWLIYLLMGLTQGAIIIWLVWLPISAGRGAWRALAARLRNRHKSPS
jgi:hypothetical protein